MVMLHLQEIMIAHRDHANQIHHEIILSHHEVTHHSPLEIILNRHEVILNQADQVEEVITEAEEDAHQEAEEEDANNIVLMCNHSIK
jgi:hypothetical protein